MVNNVDRKTNHNGLSPHTTYPGGTSISFLSTNIKHSHLEVIRLNSEQANANHENDPVKKLRLNRQVNKCNNLRSNEDSRSRDNRETSDDEIFNKTSTAKPNAGRMFTRAMLKASQLR